MPFHSQCALKERCIDLAMHSHWQQSVWRKASKTDVAEPEKSSFTVHSFFFLVKTWHLNYPQCNYTTNVLVGHLRVSCW